MLTRVSVRTNYSEKKSPTHRNLYAGRCVLPAANLGVLAVVQTPLHVLTQLTFERFEVLLQKAAKVPKQ